MSDHPREQLQSDQQTPEQSSGGDGRSRGPTSPPSTIDLISGAWELIQERPMETLGYPVLLHFVLGLVQFVVVMVGVGGIFLTSAGAAALGDTGGGVLMTVGTALLGAGAFILSVALAGVAFGAIGIIWLRVLRGQSFEVDHLGRVTSFLWPMMVASAITAVAMLAGYVLLIIPGIIVGLGLSMANLLVIDKGLSGVEAVKESWSLMSGHKGSLFAHVFLVGLLAMIAQTITCGLAGFVAFPFLFGTLVLYYNYLVEPGNAYLTESERGGYTF